MVNGWVYVYVEGGGSGANTKAEFRIGFTQFLKELKEAADQRLRVVACGGRGDAYDAYRTAMQSSPQNFNVLLVDAEGPVSGESLNYLQAKETSWGLQGTDKDRCHLMVQMMEAWIIADIDALDAFFGQGFLRNSIPNSDNVESVEKNRLETCLANSTRNTQKGPYRKIKHGTKLLACIDPQVVRKKAPHCKELFVNLARQVGAQTLARQYENE